MLGDAKEKIDEYTENKRIEKEEKERLERIEEDTRNRKIAEEELAYRNYQK